MMTPEQLNTLSYLPGSLAIVGNRHALGMDLGYKDVQAEVLREIQKEITLTEGSE